MININKNTERSKVLERVNSVSSQILLFKGQAWFLIGSAMLVKNNKSNQLFVSKKIDLSRLNEKEKKQAL